jgi:hypothetical protein
MNLCLSNSLGYCSRGKLLNVGVESNEGSEAASGVGRTGCADITMWRAKGFGAEAAQQVKNESQMDQEGTRTLI